MPHDSKHVSKHAFGVVAGAAIPAAVIGSLALAPAAQAAPAVVSSAPKSAAKAVTPQAIKVAEDQIKAHAIATRVSTLGLTAKRNVSEIKIPAGATLSSLALEYDTTVNELKKLNNLKNDTIIAGKTLKVSNQGSKTAPKAKSSTTKNSHASTYTVKSGDTLSGIAAKHDMGLSSLLQLNNISASKKIFPGNQIKVTGGTSAPSGSSSKPQKSSTQSTSASSYTVKSGDTLGGIAAKHDMGLSSLLQLNNITANKTIFPGNQIKVTGGTSGSSSKPQKTSTQSTGTSSYTVKSGDTLGGIAAKHDMGLSSLLQLNNISASKPIFPGNQIKVAGGASAPSSSSSKPQQNSTQSASTSSYTVKSGDTLGGIAASHDMTLTNLLNLNPELSASSKLQIGAKLKVSGSTVAPSGQVKKDKVGNVFGNRTYPDHTVRDANSNKDYLDSVSVPSRSEMQSLISSTARSMGVDPALALAHAFQESSFNMRAVSPANAVGVMQVLPSTADWMGSRLGQDLNVLNPRDNVVAGVALIAYNLDNTSNLDNAIASYYQGLGGVRKNGMYEDTKQYVASVKAHMKNYR